MFTRIKRAVSFYKSEDKKRIFSTMRLIRRQYGLSGMLRAIRNKANGYPALYKMGGAPGVAFDAGLFGVEMEDRGREILREQQAELSPAEIAAQIEELETAPLFSVVMPLYNAPVRWLEKAVGSLRAQRYANWELCAVDDGSKDRRSLSLLRQMMREDTRIRLFCREENGGISAASNDSLAMAKGEYIALMDQDDELPPDALFWFAKEINEHPAADFLYSDECKVDAREKEERMFSCFYLKPDWSPLLLANHMYTGHLSVYRTALVREVGGFRSEYDFSQDYDLALRLSDATKNIRHIERVLYYWRIIPSSAASGGKDFARVSNMAAAYDWYRRKKLPVVMEKWFYGNYGSIVRPANPKVSIIIPSDSCENLEMCIDGLLRKTSYKNIEIIPVTNSRTAGELEEEFPYVGQMRICRYDEVYNFSDKCNKGAGVAGGEILVFLNDDVVPYGTDWIERQIELLCYPGVGGVSPLLLHEDSSIQYAGMIVGTPGLTGTAFNGVPYLAPVPNPFKHALLRNISVLNGACAVLRRTVFEEIGGFDAVHTPNAHSDLDLSLKLIEKGYTCAYTPYAVLTHIGNHSWAEKDKADKADIYCLKRWGRYLGRDPYFTDSMKYMLYTDFPYLYKIYSPENLAVPKGPGARDILFLSHELSRTGAPIVLKDMVRIALENGDFPVVLAPCDGPLREDYLAMGVTVILDESMQRRSPMFERFARNFDLVVANTLVCHDAVELLRGSLPPVLWWIHEGSFALDSMAGSLPKTLDKNIHVYTVSDYTAEILSRRGFNYKHQNLSWGAADIQLPPADKPADGPMTFVVSGSIEKRKGQDILLRAIGKLPEEIRAQTQFIFVGNPLDRQIYESILHDAKKYKNIRYLEPMPREEVFDLYRQADCILLASRDEPLSVVAGEAMIFSKPVITSDAGGMADFLRDGQNGLIFHSRDSAALAEKIAYAVQHREEMRRIGREGRKVYEENFTMAQYRKNVQRVLDELTGSDCRRQ